ncbi:MAG TPA: hypothetical protein VK879_18790 [Candidatus Sulfomarinibacteraceae bacterium]|nr:hypothetical protein [Candidatus Sulfomarinibacteraceae bacterium]
MKAIIQTIDWQRLLPSNKVQWAVTLSGLLATTLILLWGIVRPPQAAFDDAYITYRYADNLRRGLGLVYNPGDSVLGTTSPFFAVLLGGIGLAIQDLELVGHWVSIAGWIIALWGAMAMMWQARRPRAAVVGGWLIALQPAMLSSLGMETSFLVALMLLTAWAWLSRRRRLLPPLAGALLLTRPDSALWLLLLGLQAWQRERRLPWPEAAVTLALLSPWLVFATVKYGSPLPNSVGAKIGQTNLMPVSGLEPFIQALPGSLASSLSAPLALLYAATIAGGLWLVLAYDRRWWWLPAWLLSYSLIYTWLDVVSFPWYFVPPLVASALLSALAIGHLLGDTGQVNTSSTPSLRGKSLGRLVLGLALFLTLSTAFAVATTRVARGSWGTRPAYREAAKWLATHAEEEASVATIEIGAIGYFSRRPIVDTMGLVTADMTTHQVGWVESLVYALNSHRPTYVVTLPGTAWDQIVERWWFRTDYEADAQFGDLTLFRRRPAREQYDVATEVPFAGGITLSGVTIEDRRLHPGNELDVWVNVTVSEQQESSLLITAYFQDAQTYEQHSVSRALAFDGLYDSRRWQPGDELHIPLRLEIPAELPPGAYRLGVLFYDPRFDGGRPLLETPDQPSHGIVLGWLSAGTPPALALDDLRRHSVGVNWENGIELEALELPQGVVHPDDTLDLQLQWRTHRQIERDLTVFVHLIDNRGDIIAQLDQRPFAGRWPTPVWLEGEAYQDLIHIELPPSLTPGNYGLRIGLYDESGRVPLQTGRDFWTLSGVIVAELP